MSVYSICKLLIKLGRTAGLQDKVTTFHSCGRLTDDQYAELTTLAPTATDSGTAKSEG